MPGDAPDPITVESRRMLLDALAVLAPHIEHIVLVGAHAIYLHTEDSSPVWRSSRRMSTWPSCRRSMSPLTSTR